MMSFSSAASVNCFQSRTRPKTLMESRPVDLADSIMQLNQTQTAYQAALASGAGLLKMSLMDYLR